MDSKMIRTDERKCHLLLDVGGTYIKEALAFAGGSVVSGTADSVPVASDGSESSISSSLDIALVRARNSASERGFGISDVGVAIPGPFNYDEGVFLMKHKFAAVYGKRFEELIDGTILPGVRFSFIHDVNCMLLGEIRKGSGRNYDNVALVTLGTGLGFSMSIGGEILMSPLKSPAISAFNRPYRDGILEDYASKRGFLRIYGELTGKDEEGLTVAEIGKRASEGEENALKTFRTVGEIISESIRPMMEEYSIQCLLFGGQISRSYKFMQESVGAGLRQVASLESIGPVSDIDNATFNGLCALLDGDRSF